MSDTPGEGAPEQTGGAGEDAKNGGPDQVQALLRKLRKQEKELESLRNSEADRKNAELSDVERYKKQVADLTSENNSLKLESKKTALRYAFEDAAREAGAVDTEAAYKLADLSGVEFGEDGKPIGIKEALKSLKDSRQFLFGAQKPVVPPGGVANGGGNPSAGNPAATQVLTEQMIRTMSKEDFAKVHEQIAGGRLTF